MKQRVLAIVIAAGMASGGCVTTAGLVKKPEVPVSWLIGAAVADVVVASIAASQIREYSYAGSLATGLAITGVDVAIGCLTGACHSVLDL